MRLHKTKINACSTCAVGTLTAPGLFNFSLQQLSVRRRPRIRRGAGRVSCPQYRFLRRLPKAHGTAALGILRESRGQAPQAAGRYRGFGSNPGALRMFSFGTRPPSTRPRWSSFCNVCGHDRRRATILVPAGPPLAKRLASRFLLPDQLPSNNAIM